MNPKATFGFSSRGGKHGQPKDRYDTSDRRGRIVSTVRYVIWGFRGGDLIGVYWSDHVPYRHNSLFRRHHPGAASEIERGPE